MKKSIQNSNVKKTSTRKKIFRPVIRQIYDCLFRAYGPQGWWPLTDLHEACINPEKTGSILGYHLLDYSYPKTKNQQFEIICGALLTQNTNWKQAEKALINLKRLNSLPPEGILSLELETLKESIKPAGYYNQKAVRLKNLAMWFLELKNRIPERDELLSLKGVGPETADSILLYAFKQPSFVIDAYTKRIVTNLGIIHEKADYNEIKTLFEASLPEDFILHQEYHALLVEHAKRYYQKKASYAKCPLLDIVQDQK